MYHVSTDAQKKVHDDLRSADKDGEPSADGQKQEEKTKA